MPGIIQFDKRINLQIVIIGLGANGSHFYRGLCQDLRTHFNAFQHNRYKRPFFLEHIMLVDGDRVEKKNLGNQIFEPEEVDQFKVQALAERYGDFYGIETFRRTEYIADVSDLGSLLADPGKDSSTIFLPVLIGMVDNHATRQIMDAYFRSEEARTLLYIDAGVHGVTLNRLNEAKPETGNGGQIVVGLKYNGRKILEPAGSLYPEILTDTESRIPGCGEVIQSAPQRCATNKMAAQLANNIINTLLTEKAILVHQAIFDSRMSGVRPEFVSMAQQELFKDTLKEMASLKQTVDRPSVAKRPAKQDDGSNPDPDEHELDDEEFDEDELDIDDWDDECEEEDQ
ncbi:MULTISPECIES: ThiF family adenylyltransferase [unclassified Paenibacillus]|uniref:ThiF family adenylyltransferase n=1 Tax=unclassified Paenibacillus TaxID=185978 RepID=UPI0027836513|nr:MULTISPECIES: ThiF family adenylyltransferase [unclassified Paenibacillus]MDQ0896400.1 hypothetical protein [Paenibacillus sp. V4I7]MDQ0914056.1 hypothetical protein [Paenibacillus sp. V4I5]